MSIYSLTNQRFLINKHVFAIQRILYTVTVTVTVTSGDTCDQPTVTTTTTEKSVQPPEWESKFFMVTTKGIELCTTCCTNWSFRNHSWRTMMYLVVLDTRDLFYEYYEYCEGWRDVASGQSSSTVWSNPQSSPRCKWLQMIANAWAAWVTSAATTHTCHRNVWDRLGPDKQIYTILHLLY